MSGKYSVGDEVTVGGQTFRVVASKPDENMSTTMTNAEIEAKRKKLKEMMDELHNIDVTEDLTASDSE